MRVAIIYKDQNVFLEYSPEKFKVILKEYLKKYKDSDIAIDEIVKQIKKETKYV